MPNLSRRNALRTRAAALASADARYVSGLVLDVAAGGNARYTG